MTPHAPRRRARTRAAQPLRTVAVAVAAAVLVPLVGAVPASADHTAEPTSVTAAGTFQSEAGCPEDWSPGCATTQLTDPDGDGTWTGTFSLPAGSWEWKAAMNGTWDESYGVGSGNAAFTLAADGDVTLSYVEGTHTLSADTGEDAPPLDPAVLDLTRPSLREDLTDEVFYFVLPDRFHDADPTNNTGGLEGGPLETGYDRTDEGFFHGGDLAGLLDKIDYLEGMGVTAIWMAPVFKNQPVQGDGAGETSAGYHGYWTVDYTQIDPHFGTNAELEELIDEAHSRDIKVFFDIITNHTADVVKYQEGVYDYISKTAEPYRDAEGEEFDDRDYAGTGTFPDLDAATSFPYTPVVPEGAPVKTPAWLNDPTMYHNRGDSTFAGENSVYGDFFGLDDLFTERPEVVEGMIDIFEPWVDLGVDGFRIDTMKHVNVEFWQQWAPAVESYANTGPAQNDDFFMFGEVFSANEQLLSMFTTKGEVQAVLDFGFQDAATSFAARSTSAVGMRDFFAADDYYIDADSNAYSLPTFLGNHDMGRIGHFITAANPGADDAELLARDRLAHSLMYFSRGMPVVYSGDEQGFTGSGGDKAARQDLDASETDIYFDDDLIGTDATHAEDNFDTTHPMYTTLTELADLKADHVALRSGAQLPRFAADGPGVLAFSRVDRAERVEYLAVSNNAETASSATFATGTPGATFTPLWSTGGATPLTAGDDGTVSVTVPPLGSAVYLASATLPDSDAAPGITVQPTEVIDFDGAAAIDGQTREAQVFEATLDRPLYAEVSFVSRVDGGAWTYAGTDDNAPYRVTVDTEELPAGSTVEVAAVVDDMNGHKAGAQSVAVTVGEEPVPPPPPTGGLQDHLVVHYPETADVDDVSLWTFGDIDPALLAEQDAAGYPNGLQWNGEDDYGVFRHIRTNTADGANQEVGLIAVDAAGNKQGSEDDRFVNPAVTPEVWLRPDSAEVFTSQAAAQGFATVHYRRADGVYDGWGLHVWGDAAADGVATEWTSPRQPDGVDAFGAYWEVPVDDVDAALNYTIHKGDEKAQDADQTFVPAEQPGEWVVQGDQEAHESRAAALDLAVLHYTRPEGDYGDYTSTNFADYWGLHTWTGSATPPLAWADAEKPVRTDRFGQVFEVDLVDGATSLSYILHKGDAKDLPADQSLDLATIGHEVWIISGEEGYLLPVQATTAEPGDLATSEAQWLTEGVIAWDVDDATAAGTTFSLHTSPDGGLELVPGGVGGGDSVELELLSTELPADLAAKYPHLAGYAALGVPDDVDAAAALKGALAVSSARGDARTGATGVQVPGVLDDLYADAAQDVELGVSWEGDVPTLRLWAPTARSVTLHRFTDPTAPAPGTTSEMTADEASGVWSVTGDAAWDRQYYLFEVEVYVPSTGAVERNVVTDPYSLSLSANSTKSQVVRLADADLQPEGWSSLGTQVPATPEEIDLYELHVRDFSIGDESVPEEMRGTYKAFTQSGSDGMTHLRELAEAGLTTVHLLPTFDIATIEEVRADQAVPQVPDAGPASTEQQAAVTEVAGEDGFNWGYDPFHYTTPEGSYATDPQGTTRISEYREMVQSLKETELGVVVDVVYNHTTSAGQAPTSVLDKVVPGYYQRLLEDGTVATSTCCANTATEHVMMEKLMVDSVVTWARDYKVDGFRFDLMGHHSKANMLAVREALDALTVEDDGVDGENIYVYGEGWNFGEVADDARFEQATQVNMAGTGIGTFNDRLRDAVRGGGPFDENPRVQGFGSGLLTDPNGDPVSGADPAAQRERLLLNMDQIKVGMAGNLADYSFTDRTGATVTGKDVSYNGAPTGYTADPQENILYVSAHDNETLFDSLAFKLPQGSAMEDRVRMQQLSLSTVALGQGVSFFHAGTDMLRSKSLDRNSYDSGDWFNDLDFSYESNNFGVGLPPAPDNEAKWPFMAPLLEDPALQPAQADIEASVGRFRDLLSVADSSPLFSLTTAEQVQDKLSYLDGSEVPGVIVMHLDDTVGEPVDPALERVVTVFNATGTEQVWTADQLLDAGLVLSPVQARGDDPVVKGATFDAATGTFTVPARTTAVFVEPTPVTVEVQVRDGDRPAPVNPRSRGVMPVVVLSQDGFDPVADVDVTTLRFGVTGTEDSVESCAATTDRNGDGVADLLCRARVQATGVVPGTTRLLLSGTTVDGTPLTGTAAVRTVGAPGGGRT